MKKLIVSLLSFTAVIGYSQNIGINATGAAPDGTAMLDIVATDKGILIPRVSLTATNAAGPITSPTTSLLVYNTATAGSSPNNVVPGYYYWDGAQWVSIGGGQGGRDWSLTGNAGTSVGTNFLGTTDNEDLAIYTNNSEVVRFQSSGQVTIGESTAGAKFGVHQTTGTDIARFVNYGNSPDIAIRRTGGTQVSPTATSTSGTTLGRLYGEGYNGSGFTAAAAIYFATDATGGTSSDMPGRITFNTVADGSSTMSERMRIDNAGLVGIGLTNASAQFVVNEDAIFNESGGSNDFRVEGDTEQNLIFGDASADMVGIGTNTPAEELHVVGDIRGTNLDQNEERIVYSDANGTIQSLASAGTSTQVLTSQGPGLPPTWSFALSTSTSAAATTNDTIQENTTFVDMDNLTITFTPNATGTALITFSISADIRLESTLASAGLGITPKFRIVQDGTAVKGMQQKLTVDAGVGTTVSEFSMAMSYPVSVVAGVATTIKVQWELGNDGIGTTTSYVDVNGSSDAMHHASLVASGFR